MMALAAVGWAIAHLGWQGVLVAVAWLAGVRRAGSAEARYIIGLSALAALATMFALSVVIFLLGDVPASDGVRELSLGARVAGPSAVSIVALLAGFARTAGIAWLVCTIVLTVRHIGGWRVARAACVGGASDARSLFRECAHDVAPGVGVDSVPRIVESTAVDSPAVFGVRHPVVVLPASGLDGLTRAQLRGVIAHELAHISRRDAIANLLQCAIEVVLFFHPVTHIISRRVRTEREMICDERAASICGDAATYVAGLVALEESRFHSGRFALAARGAHGQLLDRARHILTHHPRSLHMRHLALTACCSLLLLTFAAALAWPSTAHAGAVSRMPPVFTVSALDPAGRFTLTVRHGRAIAGTIDGAAINVDRIAQQRDSIYLLRRDGSTELALRLTPRGGISWTPRSPAHN
jgi:beta-lactamase regulating signal transducer with metallopeptidase domain